jgi:AcrR family transcriptional regulator
MRTESVVIQSLETFLPNFRLSRVVVARNIKLKTMPKKSEVPARIIRAAVALFSRQGYHGTSTRDIARLADVSEVTIYRYFEHKEDIFWSALASCFSTIKPRLSLLDTSAGPDLPEIILPRVLNLLTDLATFSPDMVRMIAVAFVEFRGRAEEECREHLGPLFTAITHYLEGSIERGKIRNLNPALMTAGIALTVFAQPELSTFIEGCRISKLDGRQTIEAYSAFWLGALLPTPQERSSMISSKEVIPA